jgi:hypothetical protein
VQAAFMLVFFQDFVQFSLKLIHTDSPAYILKSLDPLR